MKSGNSNSEEIDPKVLNWKFTCVKSHLFCYKFIIQILIKHNSTDLIGPLMSTNVITVAQRSFLVELLALNLPVKLSVYIVIDLFTENGPKILKLSFVKLVALISGWSPKVRFFIFCVTWGLCKESLNRSRSNRGRHPRHICQHIYGHTLTRKILIDIKIVTNIKMSSKLLSPEMTNFRVKKVNKFLRTFANQVHKIIRLSRH